MQSDWDFCTTSLREVSRTFSRPIEVLPGDLRKAVTCGYLLCRIVDAVEDNEAFTIAERDQRYRGFHDVIQSASDATGFEQSWLGIEGSPRHEINLCSQTHRVMAVLDTVPADMRDAVLRWVTEMARGMQIYSHRSADRDGIIAPSTSDDLQRYCYFVAGTVGHMLTELFISEMGLEADSAVARRLAEHAEAFGTGLQLVNILKDITDDLNRGWSFVPRSLCRAQGLRHRELTDPSRRPAAHRAPGQASGRSHLAALQRPGQLRDERRPPQATVTLSLLGRYGVPPRCASEQIIPRTASHGAQSDLV